MMMTMMRDNSNINNLYFTFVGVNLYVLFKDVFTDNYRC